MKSAGGRCHLHVVVPGQPAPRPHDPSQRGYSVVYREAAGEVNRCPGCGRSHWYKGRLSAECAFCGCALPYEHVRG